MRSCPLHYRGDQLFTSPIGEPASLATSLRDRIAATGEDQPFLIACAAFTIPLFMVFFAISGAPTRRSLHILNPCSFHRPMENLRSRRCDAAWLCCTELSIILTHADPRLSRSIQTCRLVKFEHSKSGFPAQRYASGFPRRERTRPDWKHAPAGPRTRVSCLLYTSRCV